MDDKVLIALISGGSALFGGIVTSVISLISTNIQNKNNIKKLSIEQDNSLRRLEQENSNNISRLQEENEIYLSKLKVESDNKLKAENLSVMREEYIKFIEAMQEMMNNPQKENLEKFQHHCNRTILFADVETAEYIGAYYLTIAGCIAKRTTFTTDENNSFQSDIINSMRKAIGVENSRTFDFYLTSINHPE